MVKGKKGVARPENPNLAKDGFFKKIKFTWVGKNVLLHSQKQGHCCCCWAFASTAAITAVYAIKRGKVIPMSKQQLIDCMFVHYPMPDKESKLEKNECFGLTRKMAFQFAMEHGLVEEKDYHYIMQRSKCKPCQYSVRYKIDAIKTLKTSTLTRKQIEAHIKLQPLTCRIDSYPSLQGHVGEGIYMGPTEKEIEKRRIEESKILAEGKKPPARFHALLVVGYGEENGEEIYLVQNSWGTKWGYKGFGKIKRSLVTELTYPILNDHE